MRSAKNVLVTWVVLACAGVGLGAVPTSAHADVCPNVASRSGPSVSLPDCRAYEMVSPLKNEDGNVYTPESGEESLWDAVTLTDLPFEAAPDGSAVAYSADPSSVGSAHGLGDSYLATRNPSGGWTAVNLEPSAYGEVVYQGFSEDLSVGILDTCERPEEPRLAPQAPSGEYNILYSHTNSDGGNGGYRALVTVKPPTQLPCKHNTASFGSSAETGRPHGPLYAGGTSDLSHILFEANDALTANATPTGAEENNLYDEVGGELRLVNVLPGESHGEPDAAFGSPWQGGGNPSDFSHVISADGSRIFWTALEPVANIKVPGGFEKRPKALYVRENGTETVQIDAAEPGCISEGKCVSGGGWFWAASSDGEKAFFTDCRRLTADSTAVSSGGCGTPGDEGGGKLPEARGNELYEWDEGHLTDLTIDGNASDALGADVQGVLGASENGEYVYFVADGVLTEGANVQGEEPAAGQPNLYVRHEGATRFIAVLSAQDGQNHAGDGTEGAGFGDWQPDLGHRTAEVTPDGRGVVFMSDRSLTGYDNISDGEAMNEVYIYDAETEPHLSCASCDPGGAPPSVFFGNRGHNSSFLPVSGYGGSVGGSKTYQPRWLSEEGDRVFFDSVEPLVPQDTNGLRDVYEWERDGAGSCQTAEGCVYLLSGGTSTDSSSLIDASANGEDAFIVTRAQLVPQDRNEDYDLYDARVGGVQPLSAPACSGTGCQGVPSAPPLFATPPSATFNGVGNFEAPPPTPAVKPKAKAKPLTNARRLADALRSCRMKVLGKRAGCEKRVRKEYASARAGVKGKHKVQR